MGVWPVLALVLALLAAACAQAGPTRTLARGDGGSTPLRLYGPQAGCPDTLIFSHGLGGSQDGAAGLANAMAEAGWRVMVMGHVESGRPLLRDAILSGDMRTRLIATAADPARHRARFADLEATLREATRDCRPRRLLLAGHSMGAITTMLEAGAVARFGRLGADRFDAYVAVSPQGVGAFWAEGAWRDVRKPVLMVTGTRDQGADGDYTTRFSAFEGLPPGRHRLAVIDGATHLELSAGQDRLGRAIARLIEDFLADRPSQLPGVRVTQR